jgi:hypothetical protein
MVPSRERVVSGFHCEATTLIVTSLQSSSSNKAGSVELLDPASSLLLTKPTMTVPHRGGLRLQPDSGGYQILAEWIAEGRQDRLLTSQPCRSSKSFPNVSSSSKVSNRPLLVRPLTTQTVRSKTSHSLLASLPQQKL